MTTLWAQVDVLVEIDAGSTGAPDQVAGPLPLTGLAASAMAVLALLVILLAYGIWLLRHRTETT